MKKRNYVISLALISALGTGCMGNTMSAQPIAEPNVKITTSTFSSKSVVVNNGYSIGDTSIEENADGGYTVTFNIQPPEMKKSS